ncbi:hypothetical protein LQ564_08690 [Massilia sp. G4R7]|uniref:Lipoprotein n=1 Tax=Massilia phyllostachyos TaxID=2898585 RepID=A0ABS8Q3S4_9BURK|nr:hypothetical protein [Massilia phyllostachyos]MCD2516389.1 hypothetical protein [Massilia phyllostachyos]
MHHPLSPALLLAAALTAPACAAQDSNAPRPDQASAEVPETRYVPPAAYRRPDVPSTTPDRHWIEANRTVRSYNPMMLTMPERPAPKEAPHAHGDKEDH